MNKRSPMIGSRADWIQASALAAAILAWVPGAAAQPGDSRAAAGPPMALGSDATAPTPEYATPRAVNAAPQNPKMTIQVRSLGSVDGPPIGLLDTGNGGLGGDIWQDSPRARVEDMLNRLPLATPVVSVHALARRLVLTTADAPIGDARHAFVSVRLRTLLDAGMLEDAGNLAVKVTPKDDPELARLVADSILFAGRDRDVCGAATNARLDSSDPFWVKLRAFCYAASGDAGALDLTRAVMQAQKLDSRGFETLLDDVVARRATPPQHIANPDSLDVFLLQTLGLPVDPDWAQALGRPASVIAMRDADDTPDQRLQAAEDTARAGAAGPADLAKVADAQSFSPDQLSAADSVAPGLPFMAGESLLRQAARDASDPETKKTQIFQALTLAYDANMLPVAAQLQGSASSAVIPDRADRAHAGLMAAALMLGGRAEAAARWYDALDPNDAADKPLIHLLQVELNLVAPNPARAFEAQGALSWFAGEAMNPQPVGGDETLSFALLTLGAYDALGLAIPPEGRATLARLKSLPWPGRAPPADVLLRLASARNDSGRRGETLLSMLDFIGARGPGDVAPDATVTFVKALVQMGYAAAAHDLAVDALLLHRPAQSASAS
jgi:hypothetical protein